MGTPEQELRLHLDTGSSDLWVNSPSSLLCTTAPELCAQSGTYRSNSSSTYTYLNSDFNISYVDGSSAAGDYATDTFHMGDVQIKDFQFGIGYSSSSAQGILGIGYPANEVQSVRYGKEPYKNLPARMVSDGFVDSNVYSIWLNDIDSSSGSLLFGGVDREQYSGDLIKLPIQKGGAIFRQFFITMTGLGVGGKNLQDDMALAVLLDTGSSLTYLPNDLVKSLYTAVNATWSESDDAAFVSCNLANNDTTIDFSFSEPASIKVDMRELVFNVTTSKGEPIRLPDGNRACLFGISPAGNGARVLGDTFLRSAYVVYDMNNNEVAMAQSNFEPKGSDVVEVGSGKDAVPGATAASNPVAAKSGLPYIEEEESAAVTPSPSWLLYAVAGIVAVAFSAANGLI